MISTLPTVSLTALLMMAGSPLSAAQGGAHEDAVIRTAGLSPTYSVSVPSEASLLELPARLHVENVSRVEALMRLQEESGIALAFSPSLVTGEEGTVSCACEDASVAEALDRVLDRTSLRYSPRGRQILIEPVAEVTLPRASVAFAGARLSQPSFSAGALSYRQEVEGTITGQVVDAGSLRPLPGVQITVIGTQIGMLTNAEGRFTLLNVPAGAQRVQAQSIGFTTSEQEVTVPSGGSVTIDFQLMQTAIEMDALVVTGTGVVTQRRQLGQTVAAVNATELQQAPASSITEALSGRVTGMVAHGAAGEAGQSSPIRLRGTASLSQRNDPVIYIDGVRVDNSYSSIAGVTTGRLDQINPADIERVEIIKGAAAATLFGTEASAGVIQIFTKRGQSGAPQYSLQYEIGASQVNPDRVPGNYAYDAETGNVLSNFPARELLETGLSHTVSGSVQGGSDQTQYFFSGRYRTEAGVLPTNDVRNGSIRMGLDFSPTDKFKTRLDLSVSRNVLQVPYPTWGLLGEMVLANPTQVDENRPWGELFYTVAGSVAYDNSLTTNNAVLSGSASYRWTPEISSELTIGYNYVTDERVLSIERGRGTFYDQTGMRQIRDQLNSSTTVDFKTSWQTNWTPRWNSTLVAGGQAFWESERFKNIGVRDFAAPGLETLRGGSSVTAVDEADQQVVNAGVFVQGQVGLDNLLFLTAGVRSDGNSAFGENLGMQTYPKVGASWVVSDHDFWSFDEWGLESFRLRAAYGTSGLQPGAFDRLRTWQAGAGVSNNSVVIPLNRGNPDIKPERSTETEFAVEGNMFNNRFGFEVIYFAQKTTDALLARPFPASEGPWGTQLANIGELTSNGIEASVDLSVIRSPRFSLDLDGSISSIDQKVTDMGDVPGFRVSGTQRRYNSIFVGYQPGAMFTPIKDPSNPWELSVPIEQFTNLAQLNPRFLQRESGGDSIAFVGNAQPTITGSFGATLSLPGEVRVRTLFTGAGNFVMSNETEVVRSSVSITEETARWAQQLADPATSVAERQAIAEKWGGRHHRVIADFVEEADYLRLQEVTVSFPVPVRYVAPLGLSRLTVALGGRNLLLFTKYTGIQDPGSSISSNAFQPNIDYFRAPLPRRFTLQLSGSW